MVRLLRSLPLAAWLAAGAAAGADSTGLDPTRHRWSMSTAVALPDTDPAADEASSAGLGKLRYGGDGATLARTLIEYRWRARPTLDVHVVADHVADADRGLDLTEAFVEWRPVPSSALEHRVRAGGFYPRLSLENGAEGWSSPFSTSFSAVNAWLGEEIRSFGAEWLGRARLGAPARGQQLGVYGGLFYGNDPAGTLLFWRGWAVHDRQTRFGDRLALPPRPVFGTNGEITGYAAQSLEPFDEIDGRPGLYAGLEWRLGRRALARVARYDNRADAMDFSDGQWSWDTVFNLAAVQIELPLGFGLVAQRIEGRTIWLVAGSPTGQATAASRLVDDSFAARFVLLTRRLGERHRISLRRDRFGYVRAPGAPEDRFDDGNAWTAAYRVAIGERLGLELEWLEIESTRSIRPMFYGLPADARERQLLLQLVIGLGDSSRH